MSHALASVGGRMPPGALVRSGDLTRPPPGGDPTDISQIAFKSMAIILKMRRRRNGFLSAANRWPDFGDQPSVGGPFAPIIRHSDTLLLSFSPSGRCPRPTPERVLVADHRSVSR